MEIGRSGSGKKGNNENSMGKKGGGTKSSWKENREKALSQLSEETGLPAPPLEVLNSKKIQEQILILLSHSIKVIHYSSKRKLLCRYLQIWKSVWWSLGNWDKRGGDRVKQAEMNSISERK